jgi:hypothetical protein
MKPQGKPKNSKAWLSNDFMGTKGGNLPKLTQFTIGSTNVYHFLLKQLYSLGEDGQYYPATKRTFGNTQQ